MRWQLLMGVASMFALGCAAKSEDELWLERIEHSSVYSYATLKILFAEPDRDDDVREARALLDEVLADPVPEQAPDPVRSAEQAFTLGRALWKLRSLGAAEVAKRRDSSLWLLTPKDSPLRAEPQAKELDHGLTLLFLWIGKLDSRSPLPVSLEMQLYEAYMTGETPLAVPLFGPLALAAQASVTAEAELCDVAGRFSDKLAAHTLTVDPNAARSLLVGAVVASLAREPTAEAVWLETLTEALPWGARLIAYGRTALCYDGRDQGDKARVHWERAVALAGEAGIPEADLAIIQAFAAYRAKDWPATRGHLRRASASNLLAEDERSKVLEMAERFDESDPSDFEAFFDRAFVARTLLGMVDERLRKAGVYERLWAHPELARMRRAVQSLSTPVADVKNSGLWPTLRGLWPFGDSN